MLFDSVGSLRYSINSRGHFNLVVDIDQDITDFYRVLIPRHITINQPLYAAHISVVRKEIPFRLEHWAKHRGEDIKFQYDNVVHSNLTYYWLNIFSRRLEDIRLELGLDLSRDFIQPLPGFRHCFHTTIGNTKNMHQ